MVHTYKQGDKFKIHSLSQRLPTAPGKEKRALLVLCHGFFVGTSATVRVPPNLPAIRFGVQHGTALELFATDWQAMFTNGLDFVLKKHFELPAEPGEELTDYYLGKGAPAPESQKPPEAWTAYDKALRVKKEVVFSKSVDNAVVSSGYAMSLLRYGGQRSQYFDVATLTKNCTRLSELLQALQTSEPVAKNRIYDYVLLGFCRERIYGNENGQSMNGFKKYLTPEELVRYQQHVAESLAEVKRIGPLAAFGPAPTPKAKTAPAPFVNPLPPSPRKK